MADRPVAILAWTLKGWRLPVRRRPAEPRGAGHRRAAGGAAPRARRRRRTTSGRRSRPRARRAATSARSMAPGHRAPAALPSAAARRRSRPASSCRRGRRPPPRRRSATSWPPSAASPGSTRPGHRVRRRGDDDPPLGLGQPAGRLRDRASATTPSSATASAPSSAGRSRPRRPAPRAGDRRGVVLRPPVRAGARPRADRPAAPPDRHALRLLPAARARPAAPRHVLEGALHPGRQPVRHHASPPRAAPTSRCVTPALGIEVPEPPRLRADLRPRGGVAPPGGAPRYPGPGARRGGLPPALDQGRRPGAPPAGPRRVWARRRCAPRCCGAATGWSTARPSPGYEPGANVVTPGRDRRHGAGGGGGEPAPRGRRDPRQRPRADEPARAAIEGWRQGSTAAGAGAAPAPRRGSASWSRRTRSRARCPS